MKKQQGFTLIELIMVIVVLGILSAFALPRFVDFSGQASTAALEGALGSVKSSAAIAHASCLANANCNTASTSSTDLEGTINMVNGYPSANNSATGDGIANAANLSGYGLTYSAKIDTTNPGLIITNDEKPADSDACVFYVQATAANVAPVTGIGTVGTSGDDRTCTIPVSSS